MTEATSVRSRHLLAERGVRSPSALDLSQISEPLYQMSPGQFEKLVANLFEAHFELEVELSSTSRDGGVDIFALGGKDHSQRPVLIQCKRYAREKRIGVEVVRSLFPASRSQGRGRDIVVTTSSFTASAKQNTDRFKDFWRDRWSLDLIDENALVAWLAKTPSLVPELTAPLDQLRERYASLVDKKYNQGLTENEENEKTALARALDEADAKFYEPLRDALVRERDRLLKNRAKRLEAD